MNSKEKRIRKVKRNIVLTAIVLGILEIAVIFLVIYTKRWDLLWTPLIFIGLFAVAFYLDKNKIKLILEENQEVEAAEEEK